MNKNKIMKPLNRMFYPVGLVVFVSLIILLSYLIIATSYRLIY